MKERDVQMTALFPDLPKRRTGDPRLSPLKSALQKYIRRGEVVKAVAVANAMLEIPGGTGSLQRRLPTIVAEDVGVLWLPATAEAISRGIDRDSLLATVASLAALPKSKEAYWLADTTWGRRWKAPALTADALVHAFDAGKHREMLAVILEANEADRLRGPGGIAATLYRIAEASPQATEKLMRQVLGTFPGGGELWASLVIAAIDRIEEVPAQLPDVRWALSERPKPLDWYTQDGHTMVGSIGIGMVAKRHPIESRDLSEMMFCYESIRLGPQELDARWRDESFRLNAIEYRFVSEEQGRQMWEGHYRELVRDAIGWLQQKWSEEGRFV